MENPQVILIALGITALVAVAYVLFEKKRREGLALFAKQHGYAFYPFGDPSGTQPTGFRSSLPDAGDSTWIRRFEGFDPFGHGSSQRAKNLFVKKDGDTTWYFFDYSYSSGSSKSRTTSRYWIVAAELDANFPQLRIRSETVFDKIGAAFGYRDIKIGSPDFDEKYNVSGEDEAFAHAVVNTRMIEFLMHAQQVDWQMGGKYLLVAHNGRLKPEKISGVHNQMSRFLDQVPDDALQGRSSN